MPNALVQFLMDRWTGNCVPTTWITMLSLESWRRFHLNIETGSDSSEDAFYGVLNWTSSGTDESESEIESVESLYYCPSFSSVSQGTSSTIDLGESEDSDDWRFILPRRRIFPIIHDAHVSTCSSFKVSFCHKNNERWLTVSQCLQCFAPWFWMSKGHFLHRRNQRARV